MKYFGLAVVIAYFLLMQFGYVPFTAEERGNAQLGATGPRGWTGAFMGGK